MSPPLPNSGFPCGSTGKESSCNAGDLGSIPGLGRSPGEGKGYPLQYSSLENFIDCLVHGVTKSWTWLSNFHFQSPIKFINECHLFAVIYMCLVLNLRGHYWTLIWTLRFFATDMNLCIWDKLSMPGCITILWLIQSFENKPVSPRAHAHNIHQIDKMICI